MFTYLQRPFSPSVPAEAGYLFAAAAGVHVFISGESLHCFLVGWCTNKSYIIATSDLWLFIHASNLLPHLTPLHLIAYSLSFQVVCAVWDRMAGRGQSDLQSSLSVNNASK